MDLTNNTGQGYLFAETPLTWEANPKIAFNLNPKVVWSGVGNLWGLGVSTNIQLTTKLELIPEVNFDLSSLEESNYTLALRWHLTDAFVFETYGSTASSIDDVGQLLNANQVRFGSRLSIRF